MYLEKRVEKVRGIKCITIRLDEKLVAAIYPQKRAKSETYIAEIKGYGSEMLYCDINRAIDTTTLKVIDRLTDVGIWEGATFDDDVWKMQTNSSGWKADLKRSLASVFA